MSLILFRASAVASRRLDAAALEARLTALSLANNAPGGAGGADFREEEVEERSRSVSRIGSAALRAGEDISKGGGK